MAASCQENWRMRAGVAIQEFCGGARETGTRAKSQCRAEFTLLKVCWTFVPSN